MLSWNELFDGLKGEVQDKSKNPFFGAFLVTWILKHWELGFIILNFDSNFTLELKLEKINKYFQELPTGDFWTTIFLTFGVITLGYLLLNLARIISNISEKIVTPFIYKWTAGKGSIVLKEEYEKVLLRESRLKEKLAKEKSENEILEAQIEKLESDIINLNKKEIILDKETINKENNNQEQFVQETQEEIKGQYWVKINRIYEKLKKNNKVNDFSKTAAEILSGIPLKKYDESTSLFVSNKLIKFSQDFNESHGTSIFYLTDLGNDLLDMINFDDEKSI